jgi:signal transduction histidine kinase
MTGSLRRTLAVRFAAALVVVLFVAAVGTYLSSTIPRGPALIAALLIGVVLASGVILSAAWWLAGTAVRPVRAITDQARLAELGPTNQRIVPHHDIEEFRGLVAVLNHMIERVDQAFKAQRRLTADVSHELRTPLTALRGEIEIALRSERSALDYQRVLESALEEIERLSQISEDVLLISRAEAHVLPSTRELADVNEIVDRTLATLRARIEEHNLTLERSLAPIGAVALLDRDLIGRLVHQLLDNAVKFAPAQGIIRVGTVATLGGSDVRLVVENSGSGITREHLPHLFEPFYRGDEARSRGTGTGLGLSLAAAIAHLHGGSIRASNAPGGGARFELQLPAV